ncbi:predicted protein [Fibroporia radiculosa]|uniref:Uncharacterized protein n=1 Tax=Fibroporia radiculosa TaxID=599839 RepID=J4GWC4_9APHY|nr:predicted protein [Fibroporia radiculosa]
MKGKANRI